MSFVIANVARQFLKKNVILWSVGIFFTRTIKGSYSGLEPFVITKEDLLASAEEMQETPEEVFNRECAGGIAFYFLRNPSEGPYGFGFLGYNLEIE